MKNYICISIYVLYDDSENLVRYIGRTQKPIRQRLSEHISKASKEEIYYPGKKLSRKAVWIRSLLEQGREPKTKLLTTVIGWKRSHEVEKALIAKYYVSRNLVNSADLGENVKSFHVDEDVKKKISNTLKEYYENNLNPRAKGVEVYDLTGKFVNFYSSATEFAHSIETSVRSVTRVAAAEYGRRQVKGYQVKYSDDSRIIDAPPVFKKKRSYTVLKRRKTVLVTDLRTSKVTQFCGIGDACAKLMIERHDYYNRRKKSKREGGEIIIGPFKFLDSSDFVNAETN